MRDTAVTPWWESNERHATQGNIKINKTIKQNKAATKIH